MQTLFNLQQTDLIIKDKPDARPLQIRQGGEIRFENVTFQYTSSGAILKNISFVIPAGKKSSISGTIRVWKIDIIQVMLQVLRY
ncbi:hypothetical protein Pst134EA_019253 [Puccinia striiformis f. sp. tritici]|uniref:hypothetical protein n=1 Tax=Puccinia striiformis f. sp. tritici TaxID=168172 RepID=UPI0020082C39|nr:hypothetical protein Pst134EA_019253 [Puccinia striiformis f. sp. tritici]KAH9459102.1 hypothetical protein Pst134EA_019253 [Puccinia striiformis f. sp. tritici]